MLREPFAPRWDGLARDARRICDLAVVQPIGCAQNDLGTLRIGARDLAASDTSVEHSPLIGTEFDNSFRSEVLRQRQEGLTKTYNRFHNQAENSEEIVRLRTLQVEMDQVVVVAYGWSDLDLGHGSSCPRKTRSGSPL